MGPIVYHTHFAAFIETILPIPLFLALSDSPKAVYLSRGLGSVTYSCGGQRLARRAYHRFGRDRLRISPIAPAETHGGTEDRIAGIGPGRHYSGSGVDCGIRDSIGAVFLGGLDPGARPVRHLYAAHDCCASMDWLGAWLLACGLSRLCYVRCWSHRQSGTLRLAAMDCGRRLAGRGGHAFSGSLGAQTSGSVNMGNRRDRRSNPCCVRLPIFASGCWRMAHSDSLHGSSYPARERATVSSIPDSMRTRQRDLFRADCR